MIINIIIISIIMIFAFLAMIDGLLFKGKYGLFPKFKEGFNTMGPIALGVTGIMVIVPFIGRILTPVFSFLFGNSGIDVSMGIGIFLALDMGGYKLALELAASKDIAALSGLIYASMMGATVIYSIPVGLSLISEKSKNAFAKGILYGVIAIPFGTFVGGLFLDISISTLLLNLIPSLIVSFILVILLTFFTKTTIKGFNIFGKIITYLGYFGLVSGLINEFILKNLDSSGYITLANIPYFKDLASIYDGIIVAGGVALILCGALPLIHCLTKVLHKPLNKISKRIGFSETGISGFLSTSANNIVTFTMLDDMNEREKIVNIAYSVGASWVIGDHLAFVASNEASMIGVVVISKFITGIMGLLIALYFTRKMKKEGVGE